MINRTYFAVFRKNFNDGSGKYSENSFIISASTIFPQTVKLFDEANKSAARKLSDYPGDTVFCMSFNRV